MWKRTIIGTAALGAAAALVWSLSSFATIQPVGSRPPVSLAAEPAASPASDRQPAQPPSSLGAPVEAGSEEPNGPDPSIQVRSGRLDDIAIAVSEAEPVELSIPALGISAPIAPVGYVAETDEMEVPSSAGVVGWYQFSPVPGAAAGSSVLAAHVDYDGQPGVFYDLHEIDSGVHVIVRFADDSTRQFQVVAADQYDKAALPVDEIFAVEGAPVLTLITCGGAFDRSARSYEDNVVVYAAPLDVPSSAPVGTAG